MNILEIFNKENFENCFSLLFENDDSYKIVDGNICFFKNELCDVCQANTEGANAIHFVWKGVVDNPYTLGDVDDVIIPNHTNVNFKHRETHGELQPMEDGSCVCNDCFEKKEKEEKDLLDFETLKYPKQTSIESL